MNIRYYILFLRSRTLSAIILLVICSSLSGRAQSEQKMFWALNGSSSILTWDNALNAHIDNGNGTWNNVGSNRTWTADGGASNVAWRPGATAIFGANSPGGGAAGTVTLAASQTVNSLTFNPASSGGSFTLTEAAGNFYTLYNTTGNITANASATINCSLGGSAGLTLAGTGTITVDSTTVYTGTTTINSGTLLLSNGIANTTAPTLSTPVVIASGGTLSANVTSANINLSGNISGAGTLSMSNNTSQLRALRLYGNNSGFTGSFSQPANARGLLWSDNGGTGNAANTGSAAASWTLSGTFGVIETAGAATPTVQLGSLTGTSSATTLGGFSGSGTKTFEVGALNTSTTFAGAIQDNPQGSGAPVIALTKVGTGTLTLSGTNTYTGATTVNAGTLAFTGAIPSSNTWNIAVNATSTPTSTSSGLLTLPLLFGLGGKTVNIILTGTTTGFTWTAVSWTGLSLSSPTIQLNGVALTSNPQTISGTTITYSAINATIKVSR